MGDVAGMPAQNLHCTEEAQLIALLQTDQPKSYMKNSWLQSRWTLRSVKMRLKYVKITVMRTYTISLKYMCIGYVD